MTGGIGGFHKTRAGVVRVTCIIIRLSPWSRTATICSGWCPSRGFRNSATLHGPYMATPVLQDLNPQWGSRSEYAGDGESSRRCL